jgi:FeS assembly protein IscX
MYKLKWTSVYDIVADLEDKHADVDILKLSFTKLHDMIVNLENFADDKDGSNEKILEAIQMAWIKERE